MAPAITCALPAGRIGVSFKGSSVPYVSSVSEGSPLKGKIKTGYKFMGLYLQDGTVFEDLGTKDLVETLRQSEDEDGRKMKLQIALPAKMIVSIPPGDAGFTIDGSPPTIVKVDNTSPNKHYVRVGLVVDSVELVEDTYEASGVYEASGYSAEEITELLADNADKTRTLVLTSPAVSEKSVRRVSLPADNADKTRTLVLTNPAVSEKSDRPVSLPDEKYVTIPAGSLGASFKGAHATVSKIQEHSPVKASFRVGMVVDKLILPNGSTYTGLSATELVDALKGSSKLDGRAVHLVNPDTMDLAPKAVVHKPKKLSTRQIMPTDGKSITIPAGSLGLSFKGKQARVSRIQENSPVKADFREGMLVDKLILPSGKTYSGLSATELVKSLKGSASLEGRVIHLVDPDTTDLSQSFMVQKSVADIFVPNEELVKDENEA